MMLTLMHVVRLRQTVVCQKAVYQLPTPSQLSISVIYQLTASPVLQLQHSRSLHNSNRSRSCTTFFPPSLFLKELFLSFLSLLSSIKKSVQRCPVFVYQQQENFQPIKYLPWTESQEKHKEGRENNDEGSTSERTSQRSLWLCRSLVRLLANQMATLAL